MVVDVFEMQRVELLEVLRLLTLKFILEIIHFEEDIFIPKDFMFSVGLEKFYDPLEKKMLGEPGALGNLLREGVWNTLPSRLQVNMTTVFPSIPVWHVDSSRNGCMNCLGTYNFCLGVDDYIRESVS